MSERNPMPSGNDAAWPGEDLVTIFARVAADNATRTAVSDAHNDYTYERLDSESDGLANHLAGLGAKPGQRIGLVAHRSCEAVAAILGILKAGCAYVPLDPQAPEGRLKHMTDEAALALIVDPELPPEKWWRRVSDVKVEEAPDRDDVDAIPHSPGDLAYVIYTSGSTGRPKGCEVNHGNVVALLRHALPLLPVGQQDTWSILHSFTFDFSVWELWGALATGASAVLADGPTVMDPHALADLFDDHAVSVVNIVPSTFTALMASADRRPRSLRTLIFGGESVQLDAVRRFVSGGDWPGALRPLIVNMYGITETTVHSTWLVLDDAVLTDTTAVSPIGEPLPHVDVRLYTRPGVEAAEEEVGEIYIGGQGVAVGYAGRPDLTAERFQALPDGSAMPGRYYRTGDLARRGRHGLEYCGRSDLQVKLRGFRIELQDIEAALRALPYVLTAAVALEVTDRGRPLLVAFVVPRDSEDLQGRVSRDLRRTLPAYMVPSRTMPLDVLPTTASGKCDRAALSDAWQQRDRAPGRIAKELPDVLGAADPRRGAAPQ